MRSIKVYAASVGRVFGAQPENYGDNLMTPLLRGFFDVDVEFVNMPEAELIGAGSIIDSYYRLRGGRIKFRKRRPWRKLHVWGAGFMNRKGESIWPQKVRFHSVRGPLSREKLAMQSLPLGDPALLVPRIWPKPTTSTIAVAVIPHYATYKDFLQVYQSLLPEHWHILDLKADPETISHQIGSSELVISSSLHGLILADAYCIPSIWMRGDNRIRGDGFKFQDYEAFRGKSYGGSVQFREILNKLPEPAAACPPTEAVLASLLQSFPFI